MGFLSEYGKTVGAAHGLGHQVAWCPKYRRSVLSGRVAGRVRERARR